MRIPTAAAVVVAILVAAGCGDSNPIQSGVMGVNAEVGPMQLLSVHVEAPSQPRYQPGDDARVWLTLVNSGTTPDTLVQVDSPVAEEVEIRWDQDCDGRFDTVPALPVPPAEPALRDSPIRAPPFDAYNLRLVGLTEEVLAGTSIEMTFRFEHAGAVTVHPPVQPRNASRAEPTTRCQR